MSQAIASIAEQQSVYLRDFEQAPGREGEPEWLAALRRRGIEAFERRGFPHSREEAWRKTKLTAVANSHFTVKEPGALSAPLAERRPVADGPRLVFVDGRFDAGRSDREALPDGVTAAPLSELIASGDSAVAEAHLGTLAAIGEHPFAALNTAFMQDALVIHASAGKVCEAPITVVFASSDSDEQAAYPRLLAVAEPGSELRIVEQHLGGGAKYLSCPVTELDAGQGAVLSYYRLQELGEAGLQLGTVHARTDRDASLRLHALAADGQLARTDVYVDLDGPGSEAELNGLYMTAGQQFCDHHTWVNHNAEHTTSRQVFKGVLDGRSETVFDGLVKVAEGAQKTDAQQQNRNLLMSKLALAHSNPRLEIYADDVKCAHGSTTGQLDEAALFYLRSRGIGPQEAKGMLTFAFANEMLRPIRIDSLHEYERALLFRQLPGDETVREVE